MTPARDPRTARALLFAFAAVSVAHLLAIAVHLTPLQYATKPLLMPLLAGWVWAAAKPGTPRLLVPALLFGAGGDILLEIGGTVAFLAGMGSFAAGHVCYVTMFVKLGALADRRRALVVAGCYAVVWAALIVLLWPGLDAGMRVPVACYSLLLAATAVTASQVNLRAGLGGALFLFSDTLIATDLAGWRHLPAHGFLIMLTYLVGQYLLTLGTLERTTRTD
ncbi:putative membrane protein YhhN [Kitasatospora sp. SolWspMP-SS2h]|uniref:lysoplasmalogenase n=1 Tax=Kitasatospora sp. SolWspMP-SS2h TaxID=1305729 RepID=UPI000DBA7373|nr:lysoplasmalogenase [Kitasatospora sp. SolWspMP-SS2h]RAJ46109.1 putative membrane protein YhhN [Kitasatospora sp. SolWspMP-SS2h]